MPKENISQQFRLEKVNEARYYFIEEINQNELMTKKHKKVCSVLNYIDHLLKVEFQIDRTQPQPYSAIRLLILENFASLPFYSRLPVYQFMCAVNSGSMMPRQRHKTV